MERLPIHICSRCYHLQVHVTPRPAFVDCDYCSDRDTAPITAQFGREEWDACDHGARMLECLPLLGIERTPRKMRLISCAAARVQFHVTDDVHLRRAVALGEEWADSGARPTGVVVARRPLNALLRPARVSPAWLGIAIRCLAEDDVVGMLPLHAGQLLGPICREQFGNPFASPDWHPDWFTSTVRALAGHIYAAREFGAMPILADALQDAGCDDNRILDHCRGNKAHVRGCWVLDAILGKA
jgi:hypothetical protein